MAQLEQQQANELRQLMNQQVIFAEDFSQQGEGLDYDEQDLENIILGSVPRPEDNCCNLFEWKNYGGHMATVCH